MAGIDHYENFPVASWLCPAPLRPAVQALYHFARTADDMADEGEASAAQRSHDLAQYRSDLLACLGGQAHPSPRWPQVFEPLQVVATQFALPHQPLLDLLDAFTQDVTYTEAHRGYASRAELLDYCRRSANPVGRLMLHLYGVSNHIALAESDAICTALQLINFWQDRGLDLQRGRDYLPQGHSLTQELAFARSLMHQGAPLVHRLPGRAGWELRAVVQGGLCILDKLDARAEPADATQLERPTLRKTDFFKLLWRCVRMRPAQSPQS